MSKTTSLKKLSYSLLLVGALSPLSGALLAAPGQDLQPLSIDLSSVTTDGQTLSVSGTLSAAIANAGDTDIVSGFSLLAFEDINANGSYDSGVDQVLGTQLHSSGLPAGETANISVGITGTLSFAGNIIYVYADSEGDISEDDETNNLIHSGQSSQYIPPVGSFDPVLEWSWTSSSVEPSALNVMMTPSVIDLNGDDIPDVVFGSTASTGGGAVEVGFLRALSGADGSELFTVTDSSLRINTASSVAVGDIDLDGHPEIIACDTTGYRLIAFEHDGTYKWRTGSLEQINWGAPSIADLDSDGTPEIIIGRQVLDNTGNLLWSGSGARGTQSSTGPLSLVADINLDGSPDVVAGNTIYNADGTILWQASVSDGFNAVANFDADDYPEVALVSNGSVYLIDHDRNLIWGPVAIPGGGIGGPPTIADYDSDGEPEIGVAGASNYVVIETDGSIKWSSPTQDRSSNRTGSSVFDFDGDGSAEVVYRDELYLRVYRGDNGDVLFQTPMSSCTWYEYVLVADVDADGNAEIVAVANNNCSIGPQRGVYVFGDRNDNWVATRQIWNQHTYHITNINADGTIPVVEANNWQTEGLNNYRLNEFLPGEGSSTDAPDLIPSFVRQDQTNCPVSVNLTARVGNGGALTAPSGVNISFYQGDPTTGGTLLGVVPTTRSLAPGEFEDVTVIWNGPAVGLQDIFIVADDDGAGLGAVNEGDELNNVYDTLVSVCSEENPTVGNLYCRAKDTKISVSWDEFDSAVSYRVFRHLSSGSALAGEVEPAVLIDYDLTYGTTYTYTVSAVLASGAVTPESAPCSATPLPRSRVRNLAPVINSSPGLTALQDQAYAYDVDATDPEGTALVYSLALSPAGATIDAVSGLLQWTPGNGDVGEHLLTVVVQDAGGMTASQSWRLSVADVNDPPVITSLPVDSAIANLFYQYAVAATDPESDPITFALDAAPAGMSIDPATGLVTWTPAIAQVGSHGVTVRAGDGKGGFATQSYTLTVSAPANNPPSIDSTPVTSATEGAVYSYDVDASDADGDTLTYSLATAPAGMSIDSANGLISWTPTTAQVGSQSVSVQVEDGKGGSDTQNFDVTVDAIPNTPPTIDSTPVTSVTEGAAYSYDVDASDADGDTLSYSLTAAPSGMTIDSATGLIDWIPSAAQIGSHVVVVQVSDGNGGLTNQSFSVTVNPIPNTAPSIDSTPVTTATEGSAYSYDVNASDTDGDTLTYSLTTAPAGMSIDSASGLISWTPTAAQVGSQAVTVQVDDGNGGSATQSFTVNVDALPNNAPTIDSTPVTTATEGSAYSYDVNASDTDGDTLTYSLTTAPAGMSIDSASGLISWTPTAAQVGSQAVTVQVDDGNGGSASQSFSINVDALPNNAPTIDSTPVTTATEGSAYSYDVNASDTDGDTLTYSLTTAPAGMSIDSASGLISWTPTAAQVGSQSVSVQVDDGNGGSASQSFSIAVDAIPNTPPSIDSTPVTTVTEGSAYSYDVNASDADGDSLSYSLVTAPSGMLINNITGLVSWTPTTAQIGAHPVSIEVDDGNGGTASQSFTLTVEALPNSAPTIDSTPVTSATEGTAYSYDVDASDADGDTLTYSLTTAPAGMSIDSASGLISWTPTAAQVGSQSVSVQVDDGNGGSASQNFSITVAAIPNSAPTIDSTPVFSATEGTAYSYDVDASDSDGDSLTYSLTTAPAGMGINSASGLISWTPTSAQVGSQSVTVQVDDGNGGSATQSFSISVAAHANNPPSITSSPVMQATANIAYSYAVSASDTDGDTLNYSLTTAPTGMSIDSASGLISWTPSSTQTGSHAVTVRVDDGLAYAEQSYSISVSSDALPLDVVISLSAQIIDVGSTTVATVISDGGLQPAALTLEVDGVPVALDGSGQAILPGDTIGSYQLVATASDTRETVDARSYYSVRDPADTAAPTVLISTPSTDSELTAPTEVIGTADDANLAEYKLMVSPADQGQYSEIAHGDVPVIGGVLGTFDPTQLENGIYDVALIATDVNGLQSSTVVQYQVSGDMKVGNFSFTVKDLSIPVAGIPITVSRTYDTRKRLQDLDFGYGWTVDYQSVKVEENIELGLNWTQTSTGGFFPSYCVDPVGNHVVTVTLPDGKVEEFDMGVTPHCNTLIPLQYVDPVFTARAGTSSTLVAEDVGQLYYNGGTLLDTGWFDTYDPQRYTLTTAEGYVYALDQNFGIRTVTDPNGNTLTYSSSGIAHSSGTAVSFARDGQGRITRITDPNGNQINYTYNVNGDLSAVTNQVGEVTQHRYNRSHGLTEYIDPRGITPARNIYDDEGRLVSIQDADGHIVEMTHDVTGRQEVVRDRLGNVTVLGYDDSGYVTTETDALGNTILYTRDERGNELSKTDALGNTVSKAFDVNDNPLSETDALGNTSTNTFSAKNQLLSMSDKNGNVTSNSYDSAGNLTLITDAEGNTINNSYDSSGNVTSKTDKAGHVTSYTYDGSGNKLTETDPFGNVISYGYDANGNLISENRTRSDGGSSVTVTTLKVYDAANRVIEVTDSEGHSFGTEYNPLGKPAAEIDKNGNRTEYDYDNRGNLIRTRYPDGSESTASYDAEGNKISEIDQAGNITTYGYDALNRLVRTVYADGSEVNNTYDAAGRLISVQDGSGNITSYEYDAVGQRTRVTDPLGNSTSITYDANGNQTSITDANGNITQYEYDALNRRIRTVFPDGTDITVGYDALGRKVAETDQAGVTTQYAYDALGRLTQVTDALGGITSYTYDELGNKLTQTDAEGRTTSWTYDNEGNVLSRTLPLGQTESFTYDGNGNKLTHTSFNGDTISFSYDSLNRLALKTYPDASTVAYSYSSTGKVIGITDSSGTTGYSYDNRDRLVRVDQPDGSYTAYGYDVNGNRTELTTLAGTVHYTFDALNRLETVEDLSGGITVYTYDAVGNRASVSYPNGTQALYSYDNLNRLTYLENLRSDASVISSYQYTLGATGNRLAIAEDTGRTVDYTYDLLYRLTQESVTDLVNGNSLVEYGYDAVGNRLSKTVDSLVTVNYVYDDNDRLLSEDTTTYSYDANGNTLSKNDGSLTTYSYDYDGRLVQVQTPSSLLEYTYDDEGIRTSASVDGIVTKHLVDKNRDYAQVIEERDALDNLQVAYTYGDDLISQDRSGSTSYYHYDGLGSTRALSDASEATTDSYTYEAFGSLVRASGTTPNSYLFAGEQFNPNVGFYYLRARYMNPETGRFQTLDPFAGYAHMPLTLHKYLYAGLDPVFHTDPSGYMFGGFGSFAGLSISFSIRSSISTLSSVAGRNIITRILFGNPPKDFGIVGDFILDNAINAVLMELLSVHSSKSVFGTKAHSRLEKMIKGYKPHPDVDIEVEVFKLDGGKSASRRAKGSIGVDILVKYKGKPVVAFDLKTGAGFSKSKVGKISRRFGVGVIEVRVIPK